MRVYVVLEEDRGMGPTVVGVFAKEEDAYEVAENSRCWVVEEELQ